VQGAGRVKEEENRAGARFFRAAEGARGNVRRRNAPIGYYGVGYESTTRYVCTRRLRKLAETYTRIRAPVVRPRRHENGNARTRAPCARRARCLFYT